MKYGELPSSLGQHQVQCKEMIFYQYLPIKLIGQVGLVYEERLKCFDSLVGAIACDYIGVFGLNSFVGSYIYLTAKYLFQPKNCPYNRPGWHSDGFMSDDINYVWSDKNPTIFNCSDFKLTMDDVISLSEMEHQALEQNNFCYPNNSIIRLNQFNIHKVADVQEPGMRTFIKVSFSKEKYNLIGNAKNYQLNYDWELKERWETRNQPVK